MTFAAYEQSNQNARPVSLYRFDYGNTSWFYCNADRAFTVLGETWQPAAIIEDTMEQSGRETPELTITVPANLPVVALFAGTPPSRQVLLTIRRFHPDDPDAEAALHWQAPVTNVRGKDQASKEITSRHARMKATGNRFTWCRTCQYFLYGFGCNLDKADFAAPRSITAIDGNVVTVDADSPEAGWFSGGMIEWQADANGTLEYRTIEVETATNAVRMFGRADGLEVGMDVNLYPGCDHTTTTCDAKFDNLANSPAMSFLPSQSPFDGRALV